MNKGPTYLFCLLLTGLLLASCSATKYVPSGQYLLDDVHIRPDNKDVKASDLSLYVRQNPNAKWFSLIKTQLYVYNWSGRDSTRWINRTLRRMGDPPVIYSEEETRRTCEEMTKAVRNMGFMGAQVEADLRKRKKKMDVTYRVTTGRPYVVQRIRYDIGDSLIASYMARDSADTYLHEGMYFDVNRLDAERQRITDNLLCHGYYRFNKDFLTYTADTVRNTYKVDLTMHLNATTPGARSAHKQYTVDSVSFITDFNVMQSSALEGIRVNDSIH